VSIAVQTTIAAVRQAVAAARAEGLTVGLVPTMGALHAGHAALIAQLRGHCPFVVVSIFVNPLQFAAHEDLDRYPRQLAADCALCAAEGASLVFAPPVSELYPPGFATTVDVGPLAQRVEGASRPGHFRGVATVVLKLFNIVQPDAAIFGQKDAQQVAVIRQLVRDLDLPIRLLVAPTVREPDGLALSSRNAYLSPPERRAAVVLARALDRALAAVAGGERDVARLEACLAETITAEPLAQLDYARVVDADTFEPIATLDDRPALAVLAVRIGSTRLIDNAPLWPPASQPGTNRDSPTDTAATPRTA
jgi:pantoate--beta-alanine ligase